MYAYLNTEKNKPYRKELEWCSTVELPQPLLSSLPPPHSCLGNTGGVELLTLCTGQSSLFSQDF